MSLFELQTADKPPMLIGGDSFGVVAAEHLQEELTAAGHEATVFEFSEATLQRTRPVAALAIIEYE